MVHYARFAGFRDKGAPKDENHSLSKINQSTESTGGDGCNEAFK